MSVPPSVGAEAHSKNTAAALAAAHEWIAQFVMEPHVELGRDGAVCPFVQPSKKAGTFLVKNWSVDPYAAVDELVTSINHMADTFEAYRWRGRNRMLHAMVAVLDRLVPERHHLLDDAHALAKPGLVKRGMMIAQFHPHCDVRAVRNPDLRIARSPVPMLAMRRMALHDVLFLESDPEWFAVYEKRFAIRYERGTVPDPAFVEAFARARKRWAGR